MWGVKQKNDGRAHARSHREVDNHGDLRTARDRLPNDKRILTIRGRAWPKRYKNAFKVDYPAGNLHTQYVFVQGSHLGFLHEWEFP